MVNKKERGDDSESFIKGLDFNELDQIDREMYLFDVLFEMKTDCFKTYKNRYKASNSISWNCKRLFQSR